MEKEIENANVEIQEMIYVIRNQQVMLDKDLASLYGVETKVLNQSVKRNIERFPEDFMFQLTEKESENLKSQFVTSSLGWGGRRKRSYAFTENGIAMLSGVLRSEIAISVNIKIMRTFTEMRRFLVSNAQVFQRLDSIEKHQLESDLKQLESDKRIDELFTKMEQYGEEARQGIFFQGQIFDSYAFVEKLIQNAKKGIVLIDGYVDLSVLERFAKKKKSVNVTIYTGKKTPLTSLDVKQFNAQYPTLTLNFTDKMHDRFLIIDNSELYHIGASIKDLGKKCFAFEKIEDAAIHIGNILKNL